MKYRKKPVVIEAVQWNGENVEEILELTEGVNSAIEIRVVVSLTGSPTVEVETLEGTMTAEVRDWIIKGVQGEFYPCKLDIFKETYEKV